MSIAGRVRPLGLALLLACTANAILPASAGAQAIVKLRDTFRLDLVNGALGFVESIAITPPSDGRIFLAEYYTGKIKILQNGVVQATPLLTLPDVVTVSEQGLLSIVLDPDFASNGYLYVYYSTGSAVPNPPQPTWRWIQDNIFTPVCTGCHAGTSPPMDLDLEEPSSYASLVGVASRQVPSKDRVEPGNPDASYLVNKLEGTSGIGGTRMPPSSPLPADYTTAIRQWVLDGALPPTAAELRQPGTRAAVVGRVVRYTVVGNTAVSPLVVLDGVPQGLSANGGAMEFGPDGTLYVQTGDNLNNVQPQDLSSLAGKILRIRKDGTIPADNPFVGVPGARPEVFSYGHRNGIGIAPDFLHSVTPPRVYVSENGTSQDELNLVVAGHDYGWPLYEGIVNQPGFDDPIVSWNPGTAPTGIVQNRGTAYPPYYSGDLFVAFYKYLDADPGSTLDLAATIERIRLSADGASVVAREPFLEVKFAGSAAPLELIQSADGTLYFTTNVLATATGALWKLTYTDADNDGCGDAKDPHPTSFSADGDGDTYGVDCDCNDASAAINPGVTEVAGNGVDDDCNPATPVQSGCSPTPQVAASEGVSDGPSERGAPRWPSFLLGVLPMAWLMRRRARAPRRLGARA